MSEPSLQNLLAAGGLNWLLLAASVAALFLNLLLRDDSSPAIRRLGWTIFAGIVLMTVIGQWLDTRVPRLHLGVVGPQLAFSEARELALVGEDGREQLELIEVLGSYYTCVRKPDSIFLQFFEWVLVYRNKINGELVEFRVFDRRIPELPVAADEAEVVERGGFATYVVYKVSPRALGMPFDAETNYQIRIHDVFGRIKMTVSGSVPTDSFVEIIEGPNEIVLSRTRPIGRPSDFVSESSLIDRWNRFGSVAIYRAARERDAYYDSLRAIDPEIDAEEAVTLALEAGAEFEVPGKQMLPAGAVYLRDVNERGVSGPSWRLPLRMALRPILVHATSRRVYFVGDDGQFKAYWSTKRYVPEMVVGGLFVILLLIGAHAVVQSRRRRNA